MPRSYTSACLQLLYWKVSFVLIMTTEIPVGLVTIIGTAVIPNNIRSMTFSTNVSNVQMLE